MWNDNYNILKIRCNQFKHTKHSLIWLGWCVWHHETECLKVYIHHFLLVGSKPWYNLRLKQSNKADSNSPYYVQCNKIYTTSSYFTKFYCIPLIQLIFLPGRESRKWILLFYRSYTYSVQWFFTRIGK